MFKLSCIICIRKFSAQLCCQPSQFHTGYPFSYMFTHPALFFFPYGIFGKSVWWLTLADEEESSTTSRLASLLRPFAWCTVHIATSVVALIALVFQDHAYHHRHHNANGIPWAETLGIYQTSILPRWLWVGPVTTADSFFCLAWLFGFVDVVVFLAVAVVSSWVSA